MKSGQDFKLQVVAASSGLTLQAVLNTATGTLVQSIPNPDNSSTLEADLSPSADGIFRLDVSSANGGTGTFVLLLQELTPLEPEAALSFDVPTDDTLQPNGSIVYEFSGDPSSRLILSITTTNPQDTLEIQLLNDRGAVVASYETQEIGSELLIPARRADYQLKLDNTQPTAVDYQISLMLLDGLVSTPVNTPISSPVPPAATLEATSPPLPTTCTIMPRSTAVNVRSGPDLQFPTISSLPFGTTVPGVARNPEGTWYQVDTGNGLGWVSASVIVSEGPCSSLQVIFIPTPTFNPATAIPTQAPTDQVGTPRCSPYLYYHEEDNGAYLTIALPAADVDTVVSYQDGYHTQYVFPTCRAILWSSVTFVCVDYGSEGTYWEQSPFAEYDWNATCGSNTNHNQRGLSFGVS